MVRFVIVFLSFASIIAAQQQQPQQPFGGDTSSETFPLGPGRGGPGEGGPFDGGRRFNRFSSSPLIVGPGPVIGGNGQPFNGQGFGNNGQNGNNPLNQFPFVDNSNNQNDAGSPQQSGFRQPGSIIENRNNLGNNNNGFPSIAGPGPVVINPADTTPFPPITAGVQNRKKRAAVIPAKKPVLPPLPTTGATTTGAPTSAPLNPLNNRQGQNVPNFGSQGFGNNGQQGSGFGFPGQNQNGQQQQPGFGFPNGQQQQQSGFPGNQNSGFNNNNGQQQSGFPSWPGQQQQQGFPGSQTGQNGFDNTFGFPAGPGSFGQNGQNGFGFNNGFGQPQPTPLFGGFPNNNGQGFGFPGNQGNNGFPNNNGQQQQSGFPFGNQQQQQPGSFGGQAINAASN